MKIKQALAAGTAVCLLFTSTGSAWAEASFWKERARAQRADTVSARAVTLPALSPAAGASDIVTRSLAETAARRDPRLHPLQNSPWLNALPLACATVREVYWPPRGTDHLIIQIQDVHGHRQAQDQIAQSIEWIEADARRRGAPPVLVGMEGAAGGFLTDAFRDHADKGALAEVAGDFYDNHLLTGAELAALTAPAAPFLWGVETPELYRRHVAALKGSFPREEAFRRSLADLRTALSRAQAAAYPPALKAWSAQFDAYHAGQRSLGDYVRFLSSDLSLAGRPNAALFLKALSQEEKMNFKAAEADRQQLVEALSRRLAPADLKALADRAVDFRLNRLSYGEFHEALTAAARRADLSVDGFPVFAAYVKYVAQVEKIDRAALLTEIDRMETDAADRALAGAGPEARRLHQAAGDLHQAEKLLARTMTPPEWDRYRPRREETRLLPGRLDVSDDDFPSELAAFEAFYDVALERNVALVDNLLAEDAARGARGPRVSVLVAGGFHTDGVVSLLKGRGAAVVVMTPRIDKVEEGSYLDVFRKDETPLARLFEGEKLTLIEPLNLPKKPLTDDPTGAASFGMASILAAKDAGRSDASTAESVREKLQALLGRTDQEVQVLPSTDGSAFQIKVWEGRLSSQLTVSLTPPAMEAGDQPWKETAGVWFRLGGKEAPSLGALRIFGFTRAELKASASYIQNSLRASTAGGRVTAFVLRHANGAFFVSGMVLTFGLAAAVMAAGTAVGLVGLAVALGAFGVVFSIMAAQQPGATWVGAARRFVFISGALAAAGALRFALQNVGVVGLSQPLIPAIMAGIALALNRPVAPVLAAAAAQPLAFIPLARVNRAFVERPEEIAEMMKRRERAEEPTVVMPLSEVDEATREMKRPEVDQDAATAVMPLSPLKIDHDAKTVVTPLPDVDEVTREMKRPEVDQSAVTAVAPHPGPVVFAQVMQAEEAGLDAVVRTQPHLVPLEGGLSVKSTTPVPAGSWASIIPRASGNPATIGARMYPDRVLLRLPDTTPNGDVLNFSLSAESLGRNPGRSGLVVLREIPTREGGAFFSVYVLQKEADGALSRTLMREAHVPAYAKPAAAAASALPEGALSAHLFPRQTDIRAYDELVDFKAALSDGRSYDFQEILQANGTSLLYATDRNNTTQVNRPVGEYTLRKVKWTGGFTVSMSRTQDGRIIVAADFTEEGRKLRVRRIATLADEASEARLLAGRTRGGRTTVAVDEASPIHEEEIEYLPESGARPLQKVVPPALPAAARRVVNKSVPPALPIAAARAGVKKSVPPPLPAAAQKPMAEPIPLFKLSRIPGFLKEAANDNRWAQVAAIALMILGPWFGARLWETPPSRPASSAVFTPAAAPSVAPELTSPPAALAAAPAPDMDFSVDETQPAAEAAPRAEKPAPAQIARRKRPKPPVQVPAVVPPAPIVFTTEPLDELEELMVSSFLNSKGEKERAEAEVAAGNTAYGAITKDVIQRGIQPAKSLAPEPARKKPADKRQVRRPVGKPVVEKREPLAFNGADVFSLNPAGFLVIPLIMKYPSVALVMFLLSALSLAGRPAVYALFAPGSRARRSSVFVGALAVGTLTALLYTLADGALGSSFHFAAVTQMMLPLVFGGVGMVLMGQQQGSLEFRRGDSERPRGGGGTPAPRPAPAVSQPSLPPLPDALRGKGTPSRPASEPPPLPSARQARAPADIPEVSLDDLLEKKVPVRPSSVPPPPSSARRARAAAEAPARRPSSKPPPPPSARGIRAPEVPEISLDDILEDVAEKEDEATLPRILIPSLRTPPTRKTAAEIIGNLPPRPTGRKSPSVPPPAPIRTSNGVLPTAAATPPAVPAREPLKALVLDLANLFPAQEGANDLAAQQALETLLPNAQFSVETRRHEGGRFYLFTYTHVDPASGLQKTVPLVSGGLIDGDSLEPGDMQVLLEGWANDVEMGRQLPEDGYWIKNPADPASAVVFDAAVVGRAAVLDYLELSEAIAELRGAPVEMVPAPEKTAPAPSAARPTAVTPEEPLPAAPAANAPRLSSGDEWKEIRRHNIVIENDVPGGKVFTFIRKAIDTGETGGHMHYALMGSGFLSTAAAAHLDAGALAELGEELNSLEDAWWAKRRAAPTAAPSHETFPVWWDLLNKPRTMVLPLSGDNLLVNADHQKVGKDAARRFFAEHKKRLEKFTAERKAVIQRQDEMEKALREAAPAFSLPSRQSRFKAFMNFFRPKVPAPSAAASSDDETARPEGETFSPPSEKYRFKVLLNLFRPEEKKFSPGDPRAGGGTFKSRAGDGGNNGGDDGGNGGGHDGNGNGPNGGDPWHKLPENFSVAEAQLSDGSGTVFLLVSFEPDAPVAAAFLKAGDVVDDAMVARLSARLPDWTDNRAVYWVPDMAASDKKPLDARNGAHLSPAQLAALKQALRGYAGDAAQAAKMAEQWGLSLKTALWKGLPDGVSAHSITFDDPSDAHTVVHFEDRQGNSLGFGVLKDETSMSPELLSRLSSLIQHWKDFEKKPFFLYDLANPRTVREFDGAVESGLPRHFNDALDGLLTDGLLRRKAAEGGKGQAERILRIEKSVTDGDITLFFSPDKHRLVAYGFMPPGDISPARDKLIAERLYHWSATDQEVRWMPDMLHSREAGPFADFSSFTREQEQTFIDLHQAASNQAAPPSPSGEEEHPAADDIHSRPTQPPTPLPVQPPAAKEPAGSWDELPQEHFTLQSKVSGGAILVFMRRETDQPVAFGLVQDGKPPTSGNIRRLGELLPGWSSPDGRWIPDLSKPDENGPVNDRVPQEAHRAFVQAITNHQADRRTVADQEPTVEVLPATPSQREEAHAAELFDTWAAWQAERARVDQLEEQLKKQGASAEAWQAARAHVDQLEEQLQKQEASAESVVSQLNGFLDETQKGNEKLWWSRLKWQAAFAITWLGIVIAVVMNISNGPAHPPASEEKETAPAPSYDYGVSQPRIEMPVTPHADVFPSGLDVLPPAAQVQEEPVAAAAPAAEVAAAPVKAVSPAPAHSKKKAPAPAKKRLTEEEERNPYVEGSRAERAGEAPPAPAASVEIAPAAPVEGLEKLPESMQKNPFDDEKETPSAAPAAPSANPAPAAPSAEPSAPPAPEGTASPAEQSGGMPHLIRTYPGDEAPQPAAGKIEKNDIYGGETLGSGKPAGAVTGVSVGGGAWLRGWTYRGRAFLETLLFGGFLGGAIWAASVFAPVDLQKPVMAALSLSYGFIFWQAHRFFNEVVLDSPEVIRLARQKMFIGLAVATATAAGGLFHPLVVGALALGIFLSTWDHYRLNRRIAEREADLQDAARRLPADAQRLLGALPALAGVTKLLADVHGAAVGAETPRAFAESLPEGLRRYGAKGLQTLVDAFNALRLERAALDDKGVLLFDVSRKDEKGYSKLRQDLDNLLARPDLQARVEVGSRDMTPQDLRSLLTQWKVDPSRVVVRELDESLKRDGLWSDALLLARIQKDASGVQHIAVVTASPREWVPSDNIIPAVGRVLKDLLHAIEEMKLTATNA